MADLVVTTARCRCGQVEMEARGEPFMRLACYCSDCQEGGHRIEALPDATPIVRPDGGTEYVLYRRDRVHVTRGAERLQDHKLKPGSSTKRVVASCCNTAMFLGNKYAHWVSTYRARLPDPPPVEFKIMTKRAPGPVAAEGVPTYRGGPPRFFVRVLAAGIPMLLRRR